LNRITLSSFGPCAINSCDTGANQCCKAQTCAMHAKIAADPQLGTIASN